jgi:LysM repeat protein
MKKNFLLALILFCGTIVFAQSNKQSYIEHKVAPKENFYSIARLYNVSPKDIETLNGLDMKKGLVVGQILKIPSNANNSSQSIETRKPIYYVVQPHEGLYRVSVKNHNVSMDDLRKWNKLSNDNITPGQKLIVGYTSSKESKDVAVVKESVVKQEETKQPVEEKKEQVVTKQETANVSNETTQKKIEPEKRTEPERKIETPTTTQISHVAITDANGGYFKSQFDLQIKTQPVKADQTASAGIFKTSSGWQDAKYYALMDNVEPGTIIRVINPTNSKAIYAKVLGEMSGIRQNQGYDVRISNAAASALDVSDTDKFIVRVNY